MNSINNIINNLNFGLAEHSKLSVKFISASENDYGDTSIFLSILKDGKEIARDFKVKSIDYFKEPSHLEKLIYLISHEYN